MADEKITLNSAPSLSRAVDDMAVLSAENLSLEEREALQGRVARLRERIEAFVEKQDDDPRLLVFQKLLFRLRLLARGSPTKAVAQKQSTAGIRIDSLQGSPSPAKDAGGQRSFAAASPSAKETKKDEERKSKEERASPPDQRVKASPARREGSPQGGDRTPPKTAGASLSSPATSMGTAQSPQSRAMSETRASTRRKPLYEWETRESRAYDDRVSPWSTETGRTKSRASSSDGQGKWFLEDANHVDMVLELTPEEYSELKARRSLRTHQQRLEKARSVRQSTFSLFG